MVLNPAEEREKAHAYLDRLPASQLSAVRSLLEAMLDRFPIEDEEIGKAEERAAADAREWLKHNNPIPNEALLAEFDLTLDDFERLGRTPLPSESNAGQ
jgi:hypothetical protein